MPRNGPEARYEQREAIQLSFIVALQQLPAKQRAAPLPDSPAERNLLAIFSDAVEAGDSARLLTLLSSDARKTMPPQPGELIGHDAIGAYLDRSAEVNCLGNPR
jgi:RNA polymerase sigma-70 factor (ECF subfamily)